MSGSKMTSVLTAADVVGGYKMAGTPDGLGAFDNNDGTFTLLMNHEFGNTAGTTRAHGSTGAFVSKWVIRKSDLTVISGGDLIQRVNLWNPTTKTYTAYYAASPSTSAALTRFCSADLPEVAAFYNVKTGKGTTERIFMNGEESGNEGRGFGHIATGPNAGSSYELPYLGKFSWENSVARPVSSDTTVVIGMDDTSPNGQVYVYIGSKKNTGNEIDKAGLNGGHLYGVAVPGMLLETAAGLSTTDTTFSLVDLGDVSGMTGTALNTASNTAGVTGFMRPEDGAWDPSNPMDFYFATTASTTNPSRLWRLRFSNPANLSAGGRITPVLNGTESQLMMDNITIDHWGHILIVEDIGGDARLGRMWQYTTATDSFKVVAVHDSARFLPGTPTPAGFLTQDEEASGVLDVQSILGPGMFLLVDQAHYGIAGEVVEGGQLMAYFNPDSYNSNPEISLKGKGLDILSGNLVTSLTNNTDFGNVDTAAGSTQSFVIRNAGPAALSVSGISFSGTHAAEFSLSGAPTFPASIAANDSMTINVRFAPKALGTRTATLRIVSNDFDEKEYTTALQGSGIALLPSIVVKGKNSVILDGDLTPGTANNTDFGAINVSTTATKNFVIHNGGPGVLSVTGITFTGTNASEFTLVTPPPFPIKVAANDSQYLAVQFAPLAVGVRTAMINIANSDGSMGTYNFALQGTAKDPTAIPSVSLASAVKLYPNPAGNTATVALSLKKDEQIVINVFDVQGKQVMAPIEQHLKAGEQMVTLNTEGLSNGTYFVIVASGNQSTKIKMAVAH
jgi:hypothetical protein